MIHIGYIHVYTLRPRARRGRASLRPSRRRPGVNLATYVRPETGIRFRQHHQKPSITSQQRINNNINNHIINTNNKSRNVNTEPLTKDNPAANKAVHNNATAPVPTQPKAERQSRPPLAARRERTCGLPRRRQHPPLLRSRTRRRRRRRRRWKATPGPTSSSLSGPSTAGTCGPPGCARRSNRRTPLSHKSCGVVRARVRVCEGDMYVCIQRTCETYIYT